MSANGSTMAVAGRVVEIGGGLVDHLYVSLDTGSTWATTTAPTGNWNDVAVSDDGSMIVATKRNSSFSYISTDFGSTWNPLTSAGTKNWGTVDISADENVIVMGSSNDYVWTSADAGNTWTERVGFYGNYVAVSDDGEKIIGLRTTFQNTPMISEDGGDTFVSKNIAPDIRFWNSVSLSDDGTVAGLSQDFDDYVKTLLWNDAPPVVSIVSPTDSQVIGQGEWAPEVDWGSSETCEYQINLGGIIEADCSEDGSDIPLSVPNGEVSLTVYGTEDGQEASSTVSFTYNDVTPPTLEIVTPSESGSFQTNEWEPQISWGDSVTCEYRYDEGEFQSLDCGDGENDPEVIPAGSLGEHTFTIRGTDFVGNSATATSVTFEMTPGEYYWYSTGSTEWADEDNWFIDADHTIPSNALPNRYDNIDAVLNGGVSPILDLDALSLLDDVSAPFSIDSSGLTGAAQETGVIVVSLDGRSLGQTQITGNAIFNGDVSLEYESAFGVSGNAVFNDESRLNYSWIGGNATFNDTSMAVYGEVAGNVTLNDGSAFRDSEVSGDLTLNTTYFGVLPQDGVLTIGGEVCWEVDAVGGVVYGSDSEEIGTFVFMEDSCNRGAVPVDAEFHDDSYNSDSIEGNSEFNDDSSNGSVVEGNAVFNDSSRNDEGTVNGSAEFNDYSLNRGMVAGNATFRESSANRSDGSIQGDVDVYYPVIAPLQGSFSDVTYHDYPEGILYFNNSQGDGDWGNVLNWWTDFEFSENASTLPDANTKVVILGSPSQNTGDPAVAQSATFRESTNSISLTVTDGVLFTQSSQNGDGGSIQGDVVFRQYSYNYGPITGDVEFFTNTSNGGVIQGDVVFWGNSTNGANISGTATFNDSSYNSSEMSGSAVFNDESYNNGDILSDAHFNDRTTNIGLVAGDAFFNTTYFGALPEGGVIEISENYWDSEVQGISYGSDNQPLTRFVFSGQGYAGEDAVIVGDAEFSGESYSYANITGDAQFIHRTVNQGGVEGSAIFSDGAYNNGTVEGDAVFNDRSYNRGNLNGNAVFRDFSANDSSVAGNVDVYYPAQAPLGGAVEGSLTYHDYPDGILYFNNNQGDGDWGNVLNWWTDVDFSVQATALPTISDEVIINAYVSQDTSGSASARIARFNISSEIDLTLADVAIFGPGAENSGQITGDAEFNGSFSTSINHGTVTGDAIFYLDSYNNGTIEGSGTFEGENTNNQNVVNGDLIRLYMYPIAGLEEEFEENPWIVVADGIEVDLSISTYSTVDGYNSFVARNGGSFIPQLAPTLAVSGPTASSTVAVDSWEASVSWGNATTCSYAFDGMSQTAVNCSEDGSDIPAPSTQGVNTLVVQGVISTGTSTFSVSFTYGSAGSEEEPDPEPAPAPRPSSGGSSARRAANVASFTAEVVVSPTASNAVSFDRLSLARLIRALLGSSAPSSVTVGGLVIPLGVFFTVPSVEAEPVSLKSCPDMEVGFVGECARLLQRYLNSNGFVVSGVGAGSAGFETMTFGPATRSALAKFQASKGILPAEGYFGSKTKASI